MLAASLLKCDDPTRRTAYDRPERRTSPTLLPPSLENHPTAAHGLSSFGCCLTAVGGLGFLRSRGTARHGTI